MNRTHKATVARLKKLATEWEARLQRMHLGVTSGAQREHELPGAEYFTEVSPAPNLDHMDPAVAEVYVSETVPFYAGSRAYKAAWNRNLRPDTGYNEPMLRSEYVPAKIQFWPSPGEPIVNYRAREVE